jgi:hypothetical protein
MNIGSAPRPVPVMIPWVSTVRRAGRRLTDGAVSRCWRVSLAVRLGIGVGILATAPIALISTAMQVDHPISDPLTAIVIRGVLVGRHRTAHGVALIRRTGCAQSAVDSPDRQRERPFGESRIVRSCHQSARWSPCIALASYKPKIAVEDRAVGLINYWAQIPRSSNRDEVPESLYAETPKDGAGGELATSGPRPGSLSPSPSRPYSWPGRDTLRGSSQWPPSPWSSLWCRSP